MTQTVTLTYQYRIKDSSPALQKALMVLSGKVNRVWNYCNGFQQEVLRRNGMGCATHTFWPSGYDFHALTTGTSKLLRLPAQTIQAICSEYATRRKQFNKPFLRFRTNKKNRTLPWIPFKASDFKVIDAIKGTFGFSGLILKTWYSRPLPVNSTITNGSITKDSTGKWFVNLTFKQTLTEAESLALITKGQDRSGFDVGLKPFLTQCTLTAEGTIQYQEYEAPQFYRKSQAKLATVQRARRVKQTRSVHKKIKNQRKDFLNKLAHQLCMDNAEIVMGIVDLKKLVRSNLKGHSKSWHDLGFGQFRARLKSKAYRHSLVYTEVSEKELKSTQTCSACEQITGPKGLEGLGVSQWICAKCKSHHLRNQNSALNHLKSSDHTKGMLKTALTHINQPLTTLAPRFS